MAVEKEFPMMGIPFTQVAATSVRGILCLRKGSRPSEANLSQADTHLPNLCPARPGAMTPYGMASSRAHLALAAELGPKLFHLRPNYHLAVRLVGIVGEVVLMIIFGQVELRGRFHLGDDGVLKLRA